MPSLRTIRRRIRSVRSTSQITKAMEMVAASRMRRAQLLVLASRPYSDRLRAMIADLAVRPGLEGQAQPLLQQRSVRNRIGLIVMTSDRGLCGALNSNVLRRATTEILDAGGMESTRIVTVGRKGQDFLLRRGARLQATFLRLAEKPDILAVQPIARIVMDEFVRGEIDAAFLVYPRFVNTLVQRVAVDQILPVVPATTSEPQLEYTFEPSPYEILGELLPRYVEVQIYQSLLETIASEHSARMMAMRNATENAKELIDSLTLSYNKARQASITKEIAEIAAGSGSMSR